MSDDRRNFRPGIDDRLAEIFKTAGFETTAWRHDLTFGSYGAFLALAVSGFGPVIPLVGAAFTLPAIGAGQYAGHRGHLAAQKLKEEIAPIITDYADQFTEKEVVDLAFAISKTYVTPYYPLKATVFRDRLDAFRDSVINYVNDKKERRDKRTFPFPKPFILGRFDNIPHHGDIIQKMAKPFAMGSFLDKIGRKKLPVPKP